MKKYRRKALGRMGPAMAVMAWVTWKITTLKGPVFWEICEEEMRLP